MPVSAVFETHSTTEDNERGHATGWRGGRLSAAGRAQAAELGSRRRLDGLEAVISSDLDRARETARIAFGGSGVPVVFDWRLRECDYGALNGAPVEEMRRDLGRLLSDPYPGGESWTDAVDRVDRCLDDVAAAFAGRRVALIGHVATYWALERRVHHRSLEALAAEPFEWRPGFEYILE